MDESQKLDILLKIVCWSFAICPSRSVHCFCLLCVRLPCILVSSWLWLMTKADKKSKGRRTERGQGNNSHPFLTGSDVLHFRFFYQMLLCSNPYPTAIAPCSCPFRHEEVMFPTVTSSWHFKLPFWLPYEWIFLCKQPLLLNALQLSPLSEPPVSCQYSNEVVRQCEFVCMQMHTNPESKLVIMCF